MIAVIMKGSNMIGAKVLCSLRKVGLFIAVGLVVEIVYHDYNMLWYQIWVIYYVTNRPIV